MYHGTNGVNNRQKVKLYKATSKKDAPKDTTEANMVISLTNKFLNRMLC